MKKIEQTLLNNYYNSYSYLLPISFYTNQLSLNSRFKNWFLLDGFGYLKNLKILLIFIYKLQNLNLYKTKFLFIIDENIYNFLVKDLSSFSFLSTSLKQSAQFMENSPYSAQVCGIIFIGKTTEFSNKILYRSSVPVITIALNKLQESDFFLQSPLLFHSSLLYLKLLFKFLLKHAK